MARVNEGAVHLSDLLSAEAGRPVVFTESLPVFDLLPLPVARRVARWVHALGLTDLVRLPQRRNCLMAAPPRHAPPRVETALSCLEPASGPRPPGIGAECPPPLRLSGQARWRRCCARSRCHRSMSCCSSSSRPHPPPPLLMLQRVRRCPE